MGGGVCETEPQTALDCCVFLAEPREEGRQLKAGLQQVELSGLSGIGEYPVSAVVTVQYVCVKSRSEGIP